jgi:hypothetical protein
VVDDDNEVKNKQPQRGRLCSAHQRCCGEFQPRTAVDQSSKGSHAFNCDPPLRLKNNYWSEKSCFLSLVGEGTLAASRGFPRYVNRSSNEKACGMLKVRSRVAVSKIIILAAFGEAAPGWKLSMNRFAITFLGFCIFRWSSTSDYEHLYRFNCFYLFCQPPQESQRVTAIFHCNIQPPISVDQISFGFFGHGGHADATAPAAVDDSVE